MSVRPRVYLSINGEGFGHASRALAIAEHLDVDEVVVGAYGYALDKVRAHGVSAVEVPREIEFFGQDGKFDVATTIRKNPALALDFSRIVDAEAEVMRQSGAAVVVADGRITPVLAADRLGLPCLILTNQTTFLPFFSQQSELVQLFGKSFDFMMSRWMRGAEEIWVADFPAPNTISLLNLSPDPRVKVRTRFLGPLTPWCAHEVRAEARDPVRRLIVASLGGQRYRRPLFDAIVRAARLVREHRFVILSCFADDVDVDAENLTSRAPVRDAAPWFQAADVVITPAGHSSAMELLTLGKASVVCPDGDQIEQENNARRLEALQTSIVVTHDELDDPEQFALLRAIELVLRDPRYRDNAVRVAVEAQRLAGAATAAAHLRHYASRLSAY
jgi:UDP-N-acetylglucosamine--N-acetylmuramyl-(pentapeptide) pyrophosphoryl-undecaprenol N-acetylglucosamine transferase